MRFGQSRVVKPLVTADSQVERLNEQARFFDIHHAQRAIVVASNLRTVEAYPRSVLKFCPMEIKDVQFREGEGDCQPHPMHVRLSGCGFPGHGLHTVRMEMISNGAWHLNVLEVAPQNKLFLVSSLLKTILAVR